MDCNSSNFYKTSQGDIRQVDRSLQVDQDGRGEKWTCVQCTFLNHPALDKCEMCESCKIIANEDWLSQKEKLHIRGHYNGLERNIKFDTLIPTLKKANFFLSHESDEIEALNPEKRLEYLVFNVLLQHGTQKRLDILCDCLSKCGQSDAINHLQFSKDEAEYSSDEDDEKVQIAAKPDYSDYTGNPPHEDQSDDSWSDDHEEIVKTAATAVVTKDNAPYATGTDSELHDLDNGSYGQSKTKSGPNTAIEDVESESDEEETVRTAGKGGKSEKTILGRVKGTITKVLPKNRKKSDKVNAACGRIDEHDGVNVFSQKLSMKNKGMHTSAFLSYNKKKPGKGLCVVFALFTGELTGYFKDMTNLEGFFKDTLDYDLVTYTNLSRDGLLTKLNEVQKKIEDNGKYAKLVVVVLSHGEKEGILTCVDEDGCVMETVGRSGEPVITKIDEIVDLFKHDQTPSLKDRPKLFLFQNCRGKASNVVRAAASPGKQQQVDEEDKEPDLHFHTKCPIDGDIMICSASTKNHPSMVNGITGSWFIEKTMEVFNSHYQTDHVVDMMTVVNLAVAELRSALVLDDEKMMTAIQIPCIFSTYRKKFYLNDPPKKV